MMYSNVCVSMHYGKKPDDLLLRNSCEMVNLFRGASYIYMCVCVCDSTWNILKTNIRFQLFRYKFFQIYA